MFNWEDINSFMVKHHPLIINTTPNWNVPNINKKLIFHIFLKNHLIIDLIYNPKLTNFLKNANSQNAQILNGYQMLIHQAIKADI